MTMLTAAVDGTLVERLGWTLVHFLWQGALIGLLTASLLTILRAARAQTRYLVACLGLLAMLVTPAVTFWIVAPERAGAILTNGTRDAAARDAAARNTAELDMVARDTTARDEAAAD